MRRNAANWMLLLVMCVSAVPARAQDTHDQTIIVDAHAAATPFPHFWEEMFGSGRAVLSMRESYRNDLRDVKSITGFQYIRFHAIFHDELGVYDEDKQGNAVYNFSYVDQIYDGLLNNGVRPFVELSFMPKKLASNPDALHNFWYKQNVSPPKDYAKWDAFMKAFVQHLVDRYGIDEVSQWYFEVWNEPNIDFWVGNPKQSTYFELYDHTALDVKSVNPRLRVGGPSTAQAAWIGDLIAHAVANNIPLDFVSSHIYGSEKATKVFGPDTKESISLEDMVWRGTQKMHDEILHSQRPNLPLIVSEFNVRSSNLKLLDSTYVGPALANTIRECDGLTAMMSFWTFSDVFEEQGPVKTPFHGGFGLMAAGGIPKPSYVSFELLHRLGQTRLANSADNILVTMDKQGHTVVALWNLVPVGTADGASKMVHLHLQNFKLLQRASVLRVDDQHSNALTAYVAMGSPRYPSQAQIKTMRDAGKLSPPEVHTIHNNTLDITIPPNGLDVITLR